MVKLLLVNSFFVVLFLFFFCCIFENILMISFFFLRFLLTISIFFFLGSLTMLSCILGSLDRVLLPKSIKAECAELSFAQIPNTYYNINASNNSFQANGTPYSITPGSYNLNDLLQAIATATNLEISYNDIPNLISFSNVTTFTLNFNVSLSICVHLFSGS